MADARDGAREQMAAAGAGEGAEAQRVQEGDRPRTEREDVADDPADAGCGALERLDRRRVVVRLDFERDRPAVADVHGPGVLAGALQDMRTLGRKASQHAPGVLVGAVLAPHQAEHHEFGIGRRAPDQPWNQGELVIGESQLAVQRRRHARTRAANSPSPSTDPSSGSVASSGCGISPRTLPAALATPAADATAPSGFSSP